CSSRSPLARLSRTSSPAPAPAWTRPGSERAPSRSSPPETPTEG
ncbi:MAG: hypothetical protein AVDCRST_MAG53-73, partial [uncultured Solirubrobacteraceae bacterium]